ncbi:hypothetical protein D9611_000790 [Ephemerocybe angulata]|uniref:G domain-containing protein n=1 Tax=Ephemerocybe angulata TaxID=980116 RepID=A0A8H5BPY5_9AGAR|nr:hypothetical protein D9611_000790 [Tulosesus angulatus]
MSASSSSSATPTFLASDILILVTGLTGSGRSTFINALLPSKAEKMKVGNSSSLSSCTKHVSFALVDLDKSRFKEASGRLVLVDTPGFNDSEQSDAHVAADILDWVVKSFPGGAKQRCAVLYLYDISQNRYAEPDLSAVSNMPVDLYQQLCLVNTHWDTLGHQEREKRQGKTVDTKSATLLMRNGIRGKDGVSIGKVSASRARNRGRGRALATAPGRTVGAGNREAKKKGLFAALLSCFSANHALRFFKQ